MGRLAAPPCHSLLTDIRDARLSHEMRGNFGKIEIEEKPVVMELLLAAVLHQLLLSAGSRERR